MVRFGLLLLACATLALAADDARLDAEQMKRFIDVLTIAQDNAADPFDIDEAFYQGAIPGLLLHLDPHSNFLPPDQYAQLRQMQESTTKGFGTVVSILPGRVLVLQTLPNTPSAKAGIMPGDEIRAVNNYRLDRLNPDQIVELLTESRQKKVLVAVQHAGNMSLDSVVLTPEAMESPSVERIFEVKPGIGYIRVSAFEERTGTDIHDAIEKLGGRKLNGFILDLRNNPGGLMGAALQTASLFLKPGQVILSAKGRNVPETTEKVPADADPYTFPVAILVNNKTASASEIVSGSLQDHDRATIIGIPTFGKGLVQSVFPTSEESGLALTTSLYYIPSGRSIQKPFPKNDTFALGVTAAKPNERTDFKTDKGRIVQGGGGIAPDVVVYPAGVTQLGAVMEQTASFTTFAADYIRRYKIEPSWTIPAAMLDEFKAWLAEREIQPGVREWIVERPFVESRLTQEIYNLSFGVAKGDEVEAQRDAQILAALAAIETTAH